MCIVCVQWEKEKLNATEALRALGEMMRSTNEYSEDYEHYLEVSEKIIEEERSLYDEHGDTD